MLEKQICDWKVASSSPGMVAFNLAGTLNLRPGVVLKLLAFNTCNCVNVIRAFLQMKDGFSGKLS